MKKNWEVKVIEKCFKVRSGDFLPAREMKKDGEIDVFGGNGIAGRHDKYNLSGENIIIGRVGAKCGNVRLVRGEIWLTDNAFYISEMFEEFDLRFLEYLLNMKDLRSTANQAAQPVISYTTIKNILLVSPPLPEQQHIVAILDKAFAGIARAKENAEKNLQNARELFESYLQSVFANPGDGWEENKLGEVCEKITDGKHGDCRNEENSGFYFLSAKDVKYGKLLYENARQIKKTDFEETHRRTDLKPGDILITNSGTIGRMAIAPLNDKTYRTTFQKSVAIVKPVTSILDNVFCCYRLLADFTRLVNISEGTAQKNLLLSDLRNHSILFPKSLPEQRSIVAKLDALLAKTQKLESINQQKLLNLDELKKSILQKAFNGELTGGEA
jgi:type I restriction enzyme S subunit